MSAGTRGKVVQHFTRNNVKKDSFNGTVQEFFWCIGQHIFGLLETIFGLQETIFGLLETIFGLLETIFGLLETIFGLLETIFGLQDTIFESRDRSHTLDPSVKVNST